MFTSEEGRLVADCRSVCWSRWWRGDLRTCRAPSLSAKSIGDYSAMLAIVSAVTVSTVYAAVFRRHLRRFAMVWRGDGAETIKASASYY